MLWNFITTEKILDDLCLNKNAKKNLNLYLKKHPVSYWTKVAKIRAIQSITIPPKCFFNSMIIQTFKNP